MGSYPTQATFAFSQLAQLGSFWSHLFLRSRQRLHALTFRKLLLWPALPDPPPPPAAAAVAAAPPSCLPTLEKGAPSCWSLVAGEGPAVAEFRDGGESLSLSGSGEEARSRLAGSICGEGGEWLGMPLPGWGGGKGAREGGFSLGRSQSGTCVDPAGETAAESIARRKSWGAVPRSAAVVALVWSFRRRWCSKRVLGGERRGARWAGGRLLSDCCDAASGPMSTQLLFGVKRCR